MICDTDQVKFTSKRDLSPVAVDTALSLPTKDENLPPKRVLKWFEKLAAMNEKIANESFARLGFESEAKFLSWESTTTPKEDKVSTNPPHEKASNEVSDFKNFPPTLSITLSVFKAPFVPCCCPNVLILVI